MVVQVAVPLISDPGNRCLPLLSQDLAVITTLLMFASIFIGWGSYFDMG